MKNKITIIQISKKIDQKIVLYFIFTFLISWSLWSPFYFIEDLNEFWVLPGAWGPTLSALILTFIHKGGTGVKNLLKKILILRVPLFYYLFAIGGLLLIGLLAISIQSFVGTNTFDVSIVLNNLGLSEDKLGLTVFLLPLFFIINTLLGGPIAEELGWRGYAQPLLQNKYNPISSGLCIGILWGLWHIPLIIFLPKAIGNMPPLIYIPLMTAMGVIFSWLYNRTKGSVFLAILLHGGMNFFHGFLGADILNDQQLLIIYVTLVMLLAIFLGLKLKKKE